MALAGAGGGSVGLALVAAAAGAGTALAWAAVPLALLGGTALAAAAGGMLAARRQRHVESGVPDLFLRLNRRRSEEALLAGAGLPLAGLRRTIAGALCGHRLLVGDLVRVKTLDEIRATLDAGGELAGLPFMPEMERFCGRPARVYRVIDKIYDYGRSRRMRRLDGCVLLLGLRCDGAAHGGCEAACYLIWKAEWLRRIEAADAVAEPTTGSAAVLPAATDGRAYRCQYTQLADATRPVTHARLQASLLPLLVGNVGAAAFGVAKLTRLFNAFQARRGGLVYPWKPAPGEQTASTGAASLQRGDWVRVKPPAEIARTLDRQSKHRGLWFDADMLKHCGQVFQVRARVRQIVHVTRGAITAMRTPCIVLEGVHYSGEFQPGFGEQHDYLYWREAWLEPVEAPDGRR